MNNPFVEEIVKMLENAGVQILEEALTFIKTELEKIVSKIESNKKA